MTNPLPISSNVRGLRDSAFEFLARHGLADAHLEGLVADASTRRYFRLAGHDLLLMDDRQDPEGFASYLQISEHLNGIGLSAPRVVYALQDDCLALIENFGDDTYTRCLERGESENELYRLAVDTLLYLHRNPNGGQIDRAVYDLQIYLDELSIFSNWFAPAITPGLDVSSFDSAFRTLWEKALTPVKDHHETLVLRDFHVDNLMLLEKREGVARCGLLDFQDGILGPSEYDLLSLLQDARRDLADGLEEELLAYYCKNAPKFLGGEQSIRKRYAILGAQRHARILGVFVRLFQRDNKPRYLPWIPRVSRQLQTALQDAGLDEISVFLDTELPGWPQAAAALPETLSRRRDLL